MAGIGSAILGVMWMFGAFESPVRAAQMGRGNPTPADSGLGGRARAS